MEPILTNWLEAKYASFDASKVRIEDCGSLPLIGPIAVWHPLDDIYEAPQLPFPAGARIEAAWIGDELAGYVLHGSGEVASWRDLGDAGTDADRFFLVQADQIESVLEWFNDDVKSFEHQGGETTVQTVRRPNGVCAAVIVSPDGNARVRGGFTAVGQLASVIIDC